MFLVSSGKRSLAMIVHCYHGWFFGELMATTSCSGNIYRHEACKDIVMQQDVLRFGRLDVKVSRLAHSQLLNWRGVLCLYSAHGAMSPTGEAMLMLKIEARLGSLARMCAGKRFNHLPDRTRQFIQRRDLRWSIIHNHGLDRVRKPLDFLFASGECKSSDANHEMVVTMIFIELAAESRTCETLVVGKVQSSGVMDVHSD
ncbi:predicted protein [Histoplasma capsulatum var. duboisii H88]|uniref:Predicted protein n=2 Tax=Ajellomyces capsulatus TaxID=5037 RepID=F0UQG7_AJEC8|nr:predicted protein [Histoplasma capsulatum H143]EGC47957.1 predicted protein [Histoplasma capsulatum var. duboisii H88]